jgi:hypothetical protein
VVLIYQEGIAVGCGCFKKQEGSIVELKRMFVMKTSWFSFKLSIIELENWARNELSIVVLETLYKQIEAQ